MSKITLTVRLAAQAERNQEFISGGREAGFSQKRMSVGELINTSIINSIKDPSFKKLNIKNKIEEILNFVNVKKNVEYSHIVYKATTGKDFNGFVKFPENKKLRSLSFVIRLKDKHNKYFSKNTLLFEVDLIKEGSDEFSFMLNNIILMNFPKAEHTLVRGMKKSNTPFIFQKNEGTMKGSDLVWMNNLKKPIDLWEGDSKLKVNLWRGVMARVMKFNDSRKSLNIPIFAYEDKVEIKNRSKVNLLAFIPKEFALSKDASYFLNNINDSALKGRFHFTKKSNSLIGDYFQSINSEITFLDEENSNNAKNNAKNNASIEKLIPLKDESLERIQTINFSLNDLKNKEKAIRDELLLFKTKFEKEVADVSKAIDINFKKIKSNKKDIKQLENILNKKPKSKNKNGKNKKTKNKDDKKISPDDIKKNKEKIIAIEIEIKKLTKSINEYEKSIKTNEKQALPKMAKLNKSLDKCKEDIKKTKDSLKRPNKIAQDVQRDITAINRNIRKLNANISSNNDIKTTLQSNIELLESLSSTTDIVVITGNAKIDDRSKRTISIPLFDKATFLRGISKYMNSSIWQISDYDHGFATVIRRNNQAMKNLAFGNYKSPYLAMDLNSPTTKISILNDDVSDNLNDKQKEAFKMINNSYQASFLQGPPGTGKTQVISNIISYYANNSEISLISSSTNEAINNAMDRINRDEANNPNLIFLRVTNSANQKAKAENYLEDKIPNNFINKMINFSGDLDEAESLASDIVKAFTQEEINNYIPLLYFDKFQNKNTVLEDPEFFSKWLDVSLDELEYFIEDATHGLTKLKRNSIKEEKANTPISVAIEEFYNIKKDDLVDFRLSTYEFISKYLSDTTENKFSGLINKIKTHIKTNSGIDKNLYANIIKTVSEENLVNIIGITTTSRQVVEINGEKREIFTDYPVDFAVIDEVSKSITPEVIQISSLSSKFLYAGDYRQLPPAMDISDVFVKEFWKWEKAQGRDNQFDKILNSRKITDEEGFKNLFEELYDSTLFKNQVRQLKQRNTSSNSYVALDVQHRFTDEIQELVNVVYDDSEKLIKYDGHNDNHFKEYVISTPDTKSSTVILDTSYISEEFINFLIANNARYIPDLKDIAFDQNGSILERKPTSYNSMINEYNAFEGISVLMQMKNNNKQIEPSDIGYICMTRSQVNLIKRMLSMKLKGVEWDIEWLERIKIDTVDNFQGREKDIIIVDLVRAQNHIGADCKNLQERSSRNLDFYSKNERLNVAVSRAKSKLILLGAMQGHLEENVVSVIEQNGTDASIKVFEKYKNIIENNGKVVEAWAK